MDRRILIGDLGGTNLRLALTDGAVLLREARFKTAEHAGLEEVLELFLGELAEGERPASAILAVAGPVTGDLFSLTNCPWSFSQDAVRRRFRWSVFRLLNDFSAVSAALPHFGAEHLQEIKPGQAVAGAPKLVLGPGTGLGVGAAVPHAEGWTLIDGEGGHVSLPATDEAEAEILAIVRRRLGFAEAEQVLSGSGLATLCAAIAARDGGTLSPVDGADVVRLYDAGDCRAAREAVERFSAFLGTVAGNAALTLGARGGVYVAGGVMGHLGARFRADLFTRAFISRSRMQGYLEAIPVSRIILAEPGLFGLRMLAREDIRRDQ